MHKLYLTAGGGIGDFIYTYFRKPSWRVLNNIKQKYPDSIITAVIICHNSSANELIEFNPYIDMTINHTWRLPGDPKESLWKEIIDTDKIMYTEHFATQDRIAESNPKIFLSPTEEANIKKIQEKPYIAIHPFAGLPHRGCMPHPYDGQYKCFPDYKYVELVKELSKQYQVVIVGRSETGNQGIRIKTEVLDISGDNIINLVDKASLRENVSICRNAIGFIGSHSSMLSAAWTNNVPSIFFYPTDADPNITVDVRRNGGETGTWALNKPYNQYFQMKAKEFLSLNVGTVINKLKEVIRIKNH